MSELERLQSEVTRLEVERDDEKSLRVQYQDRMYHLCSIINYILGRTKPGEGVTVENALFALRDHDAKQRRELNALAARVAELEACVRRVTDDCESVFVAPDEMRSEWGDIYRQCKEALGDAAPLPTAGEEAESWAWSKEDSERLKKVAAWVEATDPAPAEPASPAEERPSKLRDESWIREAADAEDQHASVCAGDMAPTKPDCLDGVPAVLCEYRNDYRPMGERWWVYGAVVDGRVAGVQDGKTGRPAIWHLMYLTPIHHDPTDAAAEALRSEIEGGGSNG